MSRERDPAERFVADQAAVFRSSNVAREAVRIDQGRKTRSGYHGLYLKHEP